MLIFYGNAHVSLVVNAVVIVLMCDLQLLHEGCWLSSIADADNELKLCLAFLCICDLLVEHLDPINVKIAQLRESLESVTSEQKYLKARDARHRHSKFFFLLIHEFK